MTREFKPGHSPWKVSLIKLNYFIFGRATQFMSKRDENILKEVARWPEGYLILYKVLPHGPKMALARSPEGHLVFRGGKVDDSEADLLLALKNLESAYLVFTFKISMNQAYAQNRVSVRGDPTIAMSQMRILNILITYMLPKRAVERLTVRVPQIDPVRKHVYRFLIFSFGIPFGA